MLNPVRTGFVGSPGEWFWSSHHAMLDTARSPAWLETNWLLGQFGDAPDAAIESYRRFVAAGAGVQSPLQRTRHQIILGDDAFASRHRGCQKNDTFVAVAKAQRRTAAMTLAEYQSSFAERDEAMARVYWSTAFTMAEIGAHFGVTYKTVSRAVRRYENSHHG